MYGYRKVSDDLRELSELCGINRVHRLMRPAGIRSQTGYAKRKYKRGGAPSLVAPNHLQRQFDVEEPNRVWVRKQSGLLPGKTLRTLNLNCFDGATRMQMERLQSGDFIKDAINVIAVGRPGSGKSHFACALGHALIELGYPVLFAPTAALVQRLLAAKRDLRLPQELAKLDRFECLILDDIG